MIGFFIWLTIAVGMAACVYFGIIFEQRYKDLAQTTRLLHDGGMRTMGTKPWYQSSQLWAGVILLLLLGAHELFNLSLIDDGTKGMLVASGLAAIGFRLKTNTGIEGIRGLLVLGLLPAFLFMGCATQTRALVDINKDIMDGRVDKMRVVDVGRDERGLVIEIPSPTKPGESLFKIVLGWVREYAGAASLPLDENDTGKYMRGSNVGADAVNAGSGSMSDILLIEVKSGADSEEEATEEQPEEVEEEIIIE